MPPRPTLSVTLEQYATVLALVQDDVPLGEALAAAGVPRAAWIAARDGWDERVLDDLEAGGALAEELEQRKRDALEARPKPLAPYDGDLRAYLDLERALGDEDEPDRLLRELGLTPADPLRLERLWAARLREPETSALALRILSEPPGPLARPRRLEAGSAGSEPAASPASREPSEPPKPTRSPGAKPPVGGR
jgi:hypothetical protein